MKRRSFLSLLGLSAFAGGAVAKATVPVEATKNPKLLRRKKTEAELPRTLPDGWKPVESSSCSAVRFDPTTLQEAERQARELIKDAVVVHSRIDGSVGELLTVTLTYRTGVAYSATKDCIPPEFRKNVEAGHMRSVTATASHDGDILDIEMSCGGRRRMVAVPAPVSHELVVEYLILPKPH